MGEVTWIKITTRMFEDEKINFIESLPEADAILIVWIKLLTMAGKCNAGGFIFLTERIPYSTEMLAHALRRPLSTVKLALEMLHRLGMIEFDDQQLRIVNWDKHQNVEGMERIRKQNRERVARHREKKRLELAESLSNVTGNVMGNITVTHGNAIDLDKDLDKDLVSKPEVFCYQAIVNLYHELCPSLPKVMKLNANRKTLIRARHNEYGFDGLTTLFIKAEDSEFLKRGSGTWKGANFDWLLKDSNCLKVLEGHYDNATPKMETAESSGVIPDFSPPKEVHYDY